MQEHEPLLKSQSNDEEEYDRLLINIPGIFKDPLKRRRAVGYLTRSVREFINGGDNGATVSKLFRTILIIAVALGVTLNPYIVIAGLAGIVLYMGVALKDEYDRNVEEDKKIAKLAQLRKEIAATWDDQLQYVNQNSPAWIIKNLALVPEQEILPSLNVKPKEVPVKSNRELLACLLSEYAGALGLEQNLNTIILNVWKNKNYPNRNGILRLIEETVPEVDRTDTDFPTKVKDFLEGKEEPIKTKNVFSRFTQFVKHYLFPFSGKGYTAISLVVGGAVLTGLLVAGAPVTWPIFAAAITVGVITGVAAVVYNRYTERSYRINNEKLDKDIKENETRYNLLYKLKRIREKRSVIKSKVSQTQSMAQILDEDAHENLKQPVPIPRSVRARHIISGMTQTLYGASIGGVIGLAMTLTTLTLLTVGIAVLLPPIGIPLLTVTLAGVIVGAVFGLRYGFAFGKANVKSSLAEVKLIKEEAQARQKLYDDHPQQKQKIDNCLKNSKREMVAQLLQMYCDKDDQIGADKREKIIKMIEKTSLIERERDSSTGLAKSDDAEFYNKLAAYLLEDKNLRKQSTQTLELVNKFKTAILTVPGANLEIAPVTVPDKPNIAKQMWHSIKSGEANRGMLKYVFPLIGAITIASGLGLLLFGPAALIPVAIVAGIVMGAFITLKVCEYRAAKNTARLNEAKESLPLIDQIVKLEKDKEPGVVLENARGIEATNERLEPKQGVSSQRKPESPSRAHKFNKANLKEKRATQNFLNQLYPEPSKPSWWTRAFHKKSILENPDPYQASLALGAQLLD